MFRIFQVYWKFMNLYISLFSISECFVNNLNNWRQAGFLQFLYHCMVLCSQNPAEKYTILQLVFDKWIKKFTPKYPVAYLFVLYHLHIHNISYCLLLTAFIEFWVNLSSNHPNRIFISKIQTKFKLQIVHHLNRFKVLEDL